MQNLNNLFDALAAIDSVQPLQLDQVESRPMLSIDSQVRVAVRTGDTPQKERRELLKEPPDILITTPESLYLMLTSQARETLRGVQTLIVDEVHAVAGTKRGAHLAISVERLQSLVERPMQRIGLSAIAEHPLRRRAAAAAACFFVQAALAELRNGLLVFADVRRVEERGEIEIEHVAFENGTSVERAISQATVGSERDLSHGAKARGGRIDPGGATVRRPPNPTRPLKASSVFVD